MKNELDSLKDFVLYAPRDPNSLLQQPAHVRVYTQPNGRTRISLYAVVRDWLNLSDKRMGEANLDILLSPDTKRMMFRSYDSNEPVGPYAVAVRGLSGSAYISLADFTKDFPILAGKYPVSLIEYQGRRVALLDRTQNSD